MDDDDQLVAIIGMAGRFPGAADLTAFWENLVAGVESLEPLEAQDEFDAGFFGVPDAEALLLDPQQRVFLEVCWSALEDAGYDPAAYPGAIGVYAGSSETEYSSALRSHRESLAFAGDWQIRTATGLDFLTGRVAYKLGLRGPAVTVQTACSTSLVATHLACQALIGGDCDLALSGGVTVHLWPAAEEAGPDGGLMSPDGHCRPFDAAANGTVFGNGAGALVLKRLGDARHDRDHIRAVIRGSAVNNDGTGKIGFTAPSVGGQAAVIRDAQLAAGVDPATIGYIEAHGTGTPLGDPIEMAALTRAFRQATQKRSYCPVGSVKANIGHVDAASGVAGVIKTVLALEHEMLPPSPNFRTPNPQIDFDGSPFFVTAEPREWRRGGALRRAGVSSLGIGGTNVHLILEEAPEQVAQAPASRPYETLGRAEAAGRRPYELLVLSARSGAAADVAADRLSAHLRNHPGTDLADVAWTLQTGRRAHPHRRFVVCEDHEAAAEALADALPAVADPGRPVVFTFPGTGSQRSGMCRELYEHEPEFRGTIDTCARLAAARLGFDLRTVLYPRLSLDRGEFAGAGVVPEGGRTLDEVSIGQPAVFAVQYAVANLLRRWGVRPDVVVGHSLGGYAAACVAGVFSLPGALDLVIERGRLLQTVPAGEMLAVPLPEAELVPLLDADLDLAAVNGPARCVVAGPSGPIARLADRLDAIGVDARRLRIPVPMHSRYVEPLMAEFEKRVGALPLGRPEIPVVSETTGERVTAEEITSPAYWSAHLRQTVRFGDALATLFREPAGTIVEVGPGQALTSFARRHPGRPAGITTVAVLPHTPEADTSELATLLTAVGHLWSVGVAVDWPRLHQGRPRRRVPLPAYPFERRRYTVGPPNRVAAEAPPPLPAEEPQARPTAEAVSVHDRAGTDAEARVAVLFRQLLGTSEVGSQDDFFELGGDSVIAAQLIRLVWHTFEVRVSMRAIFRNPTAAGLARYIDRQRSGPAADEGIAPDLGRDSSVPCAPAADEGIARS